MTSEMEEISSISDLKKLGFTYADKIFGKYYSCPISFTSQFYFCPVPLRMDTYSGCSHGCLYCFANNSDMKFINNEENIHTEFSSSIYYDKKALKWLDDNYNKLEQPVLFWNIGV